MGKSCFVVMPIGDVVLPTKTISQSELRSRYDDLIKEALQKAQSDLEVVRADEVAAPGGITTDIFTRLMHSDYVVTDITFPNPNVFYELGIRHACRPGTVLVREKGGPGAPFDLAGSRHIEYENTPSGLKHLASKLQEKFRWFDLHPGDPDNDVLALAKLTGYQFQNYGKNEEDERKAAVFHAFTEFAKHPELLELLIASASGTPVDQGEMMKQLAQKPEVMRAFLYAMVKSGHLKL